jgi:hypothetical protein
VALARKMHQTTVRFDAELWADLEREAQRNGVSAAQYIRDATLARIAYSAGARGEPGPGSARGARQEAVAHAHERIADSEAVWAQARLARARAQVVRDAARDTTRFEAARERGRAEILGGTDEK